MNFAAPAAAAAAAPAPFAVAHNSFSFDLPAAAPAAAASSSWAFPLASSAPTAAAAAAASSAPSPDSVIRNGAFSSQPVSLGAVHSGGAKLEFAASMPAKPAKSVEIDFSELENDIADMEAARRAEFESGLAANAALISSEKRGTAALPSQVGDSALFHSMVLKQYGKLHHLEEVNPKKAFVSRKAKARDARKAKKAEDKADQLAARGGNAIRNKRVKNSAKGVY